MKLPGKKSNVIAAALWIISIILAFVISPSSSFIWLPDALLLIGFVPLLINYRARWLWLVFGILNIFIGCVLLIVAFLPDEALQPYHLVSANHHMRLYHPYYVWIIVGFISTVIGSLALITSLVDWLRAKYFAN